VGPLLAQRGDLDGSTGRVTQRQVDLAARERLAAAR
jgi:hypothetical protein